MLLLPSTNKVRRPPVNRQRSPEEETKITGPSSRASSRTSHRSSDTMQPSQGISRQTSSSSMTLHIRPSLSSSSVASSDGPNDLSKSQMDIEALEMQKRLQERNRELHQARVPASIPFHSRRSSVGILIDA